MDINTYIKNELDLYFGDSKDEMSVMVRKSVEDLAKVFIDQDHSGFSAKEVLSIIERLFRFKPLTPLTGEDSEWEEFNLSKAILQNKRYPSVFKNTETGEVFDISGKVFSIDNGKSWFSSKDSKIPVTFPYMPNLYPEEIYLDEK